MASGMHLSLHGYLCNILLLWNVFWSWTIINRTNILPFANWYVTGKIKPFYSFCFVICFILLMTIVHLTVITWCFILLSSIIRHIHNAIWAAYWPIPRNYYLSGTLSMHVIHASSLRAFRWKLFCTCDNLRSLVQQNGLSCTCTIQIIKAKAMFKLLL